MRSRSRRRVRSRGHQDSQLLQGKQLVSTPPPSQGIWGTAEQGLHSQPHLLRLDTAAFPSQKSEAAGCLPLGLGTGFPHRGWVWLLGMGMGWNSSTVTREATIQSLAASGTAAGRRGRTQVRAGSCNPNRQ